VARRRWRRRCGTPAVEAPLGPAGAESAAGARLRWRRRCGTPAVEAPLGHAGGGGATGARRRWRRRWGTPAVWHASGGGAAVARGIAPTSRGAGPTCVCVSGSWFDGTGSLGGWSTANEQWRVCGQCRSHSRGCRVRRLRRSSERGCQCPGQSVHGQMFVASNYCSLGQKGWVVHHRRWWRVARATTLPRLSSPWGAPQKRAAHPRRREDAGAVQT
jgi:hypothetical protein